MSTLIFANSPATLAVKTNKTANLTSKIVDKSEILVPVNYAANGSVLNAPLTYGEASISTPTTYLTNGPSANVAKYDDTFEVLVPVTYSVLNSISVPVTQNNAVTTPGLNINEYGGSLYFNGANDYLIVSPNNINSNISSGFTNLALGGRLSTDNNSISFTASSNNIGNTYSVNLNGTTDYVTTANAIAMTFAGDFTMECYVQAFSPSVDVYIADTRAALTATNWLWRFAVVSGALRPQVIFNGVTYTGTTTKIDGYTWHHVAVTRTGTTVRFYVDGIVDATTATVSVTLTPAGTALRIGHDTAAGTNYFGGNISNFRIINGTALYGANNFTPPTLPLSNNATANTVLCTFQNSTFVDTSGSNFTVTPSGSAYMTQTNNIFLYLGSSYTGNGTANAALSNTVATNPNVANGFNGYYGNFVGNNYLTVAANTAFNLGTNNFCVECWVYPTSLAAAAAGGRVWSLGTAAGQAIQLYANSVGLGLVYPATTSTSSAFNTTSSFAPLPYNTWTHIAVQRTSATNVNILRNGSILGTITTSAANWNITGTPALYIGSDNTANAKFVGYMSNFRIINGNSVYTANTIAIPSANLSTNSTTTVLALQTGTSTQDLGTNALTITSANTTSMIQTGTSNGTIGAGVFDFAGHDYTMEGWFYLNDYPGTSATGRIFEFNDGSASRRTGLSVVTLGLSAYAESTSGTNALNMPLPAPKRWHHFAFSRVSGFTSVYINGVYQGNIGGYSYSSCILNVGFDVYATSVLEKFNGAISNLRAIKGAGLYTGSNTSVNNFVIPTAPLTNIANSSALTVLLAYQNTIPVDNSPYANKIGYVALPFGNGNPVTSSPNTSMSNPWFATSNGTVDMWVYPLANTGNLTIVDQKVSNTGGVGNWNVILNNGVLTYNYDGNNVITGPVLGKNTWSHVAVTKDSSNVYLYANGTLVNTIAMSNSFGNTTQSLYIGASQQGGVGNYFNGYISNLRIANTVITPPAGGPLYPTDTSANNLLLIGQEMRPQSISVKFPGIQTATSYFSETYNTTMASVSFGTNDFTIETWVNMPALPLTDTLSVSTTAAVNPYTAYAASNATVTQFALMIGKTKLGLSNGTAMFTSSAVHNMVANTWYHVAATRESGVIYYYVNGVAVGSNSSFTGSIPVSTPSTIYIGGDPLSGNTQFRGYMSNMRVTKQVALYTQASAPFTPPTQPLSATNTFSGFIGLNLNDSGYNYDMSTNTGLTNGLNVVASSLNPFGAMSTYDNGPYNYTITYPKTYTGQIRSFNPFGATSASSAAYKQQVISVNTAIKTYNNLATNIGNLFPITTTTTFNAPTTKYVDTSSQQYTVYVTNKLSGDVNILDNPTSITDIATPAIRAAQSQIYSAPTTQAVQINTTVTPTANAGGALTQFEEWV